MASLGVLGQLMQTLTPQMPNYDPLDVQRQRTQNQTGLITLADLKQKQAAEAAMFARIQNDPAVAQQLFGGGPVLGSLQPPQGPPGAGPMTQQPVQPGPPPGGPQPVPGGQDLSQFATQGGPQSTIASLGPAGQPQMQAPRNPLLEMARTDPRAAMMLQQQMQGQQDRQFKLEEQRLDWTGKKMGYFGQVLQGVNSPESYGQAVQEIGRIDPQAAARLPQMYSKEALQPFIKQALSVKESADLQLRTMHEQTEQGKLQVQLAQAGYQGLGTDVTGILRGLSEEQVKEFGGRVSPKAIAYANEQVKKLDLEKREKEGLAGAQATAQAQQQARLDKTVSEAFGERTTKIYDAQTGQTVDARMKVKDYEALPAGRVKELSANSTEIMENVNNAIPLVAQLQTYMDKIYGSGGILARMTPEDRSLWSSWTDSTAATSLGAQFMQKYPELTQAQRFIDSNAGALARAIAGEKGAMAEGDVERAKAMMPNLKTAFTVWPPSALGATLPDTRAVALRTMNSMVDTINARMKTLLGNEQFAHPKLRRYETAEDAQTAAGGTVTAPPVEPPGGPAPTPPPAAGPPIFPRPAIREPGAPAPALPTAPTVRPTSPVAPAPAPAPATRPAPPTARSTPAQDEAYQQWIRQQPAFTAPAPAPANARTPATKSTPGRQSQAPAGTRLAGAPKYMNLEDVALAVQQTGRSRTEVEKAARSRGYVVYGSKLPLPEVTMVG